MTDISPFEHDIADQAAALRRFADSPQTPRLADVATAAYDRIVLTGMGSSHFAALPTWRRLVAAGHRAWWVDSGQLLDSPDLVTPDTLLVATSQSGASGEVVALFDAGTRPGALIAITNDPDSPIATIADSTILLRSGNEATVSTKSYLNTLAAQDRLAAAVLGCAPVDADDAIATVEKFDVPPLLDTIATTLVTSDTPRLAYIGFGDDAATALYAGLITKEGAKVPAEGYIGGQFRHGPLELAGPGLLAVLFGGGGADEHAASLQRLAADLNQAGTTVVAAGPVDQVEAAIASRPISEGPLSELVHGALLAQHLTVALAHARGITPGAFAYGSKITTAL